MVKIPDGAKNTMDHSGKITSWGNYFKTTSAVIPLYWQSEDIALKGSDYFLPVGMRRSYGDCCLNNFGKLISTKNLNRFISFDSINGVLCCQSGISFEEILQFSVPRGWFLPVSPGTKFVSVGGAIANDVHGKNHHSAGTFGENVLEFELLRSNGDKIVCSKNDNKELFHATIAGLGLTGLILWAKIQLKPVKSAFMQCKNIFFYNLEEFLKVSKEYSDKYEYTVAWMDCASKNNLFGRGIFMCANHSPESSDKSYSKKMKNLPFSFPNGLLNNFFVSGFNRLYFTLKEKSAHDFVAHYEPYFYPLDAVGSWNKVYGKRGFLQFQCVIPFHENRKSFFEIFEIIKKSDYSSYLTVVKEFSERQPAGLMSFPRKGITICFDIPNKNDGAIEFIKSLNNYVCDNGGALYPAKDASMSSDNFISSFGKADEFSKFVDSKFSSDFWKRVYKSI